MHEEAPRARPRRRLELPGRGTRCAPRSTPRPSSAGLWDRRRRRHAQPGQAGLGPQAGLPGPRRADLREHPRRCDWPPSGAGMAVRTPYGRVLARQVALGTNVFPSLVKRVRAVHRPGLRLRADDRAAQRGAARRRSAGRTGRASATAPTSSTTSGSPPTTGSCGAATTRSTPTAAGSTPSTTTGRRPTSSSPSTSSRCFPQLEGVRFSHAWGGAIDTCSRFSAFFGTAHAGKVAYAAGYTGLGVGATRFGADVMLDLLGGGSHRAHRAGDGPLEAAAVPARAVRLGRASRSPSGRWPGRTRTAGTATCGCGRWTASASASTADRRAPRRCTPRCG